MLWTIKEGLFEEFKKSKAAIQGLGQMRAVSDFPRGIDMLNELQGYSKSLPKFEIADIVHDHQLGTPLVYPPKSKQEN